jgi:hypothetical protein
VFRTPLCAHWQSQRRGKRAEIYAASGFRLKTSLKLVSLRSGRWE